MERDELRALLRWNKSFEVVEFRTDGFNDVRMAQIAYNSQTTFVPAEWIMAELPKLEVPT